MKDLIIVNIDTDHNTESGTNVLGREGEGNTSRLEINIPEALRGCDIYIDFKKPDGETVRTPRLEVAGSVAYYDVPQFILTESGEIEIQLVFQSEDKEIWKSSVRKYTIQDSINAVNDIPNKEDFITEAQKVLDELSGEVNEIAKILSKDADFVSTVANGMDINKLQAKQDEALNTIDKTVVGAINELTNIVGGNIWRLNDLINSEFIHEFDFIANGEKFVKMKCEKSIVSLVGDYSIWYYKENDNLGTFVYCTAWLGTVWLEGYQTIITYDNVPLEGIAKKTKAGAVETLTTESKTLIGAINEIVDGGVKLQGGYRNPLDGKWYAKYVNGEFLEELVIATLTGGAQKVVLFDFGLDLNVDSEGVFEFCDKTLNKIWDVLPENVQNQMTELAERATEEFVELLSNICKWITGGFDVFDSFEEFSQNALSNLSNIFVNRDDLGDLNLKDFESLIKTYYIGSLDTLDTTVVGAINELNGILKGNTWVLDEEKFRPLNSFTKDFRFISNGIEFDQMVYRFESDGANDYRFLEYRNDTTGVYQQVYDDSYTGWFDRAFRTVFTLNTRVSLEDIATIDNYTRQDLDTNDKTIVGAINEVNTSVNDAKGTLQNIIDGYTEVDSAKFARKADELSGASNLTTTNKTTIGAINEVNSKVVSSITKLHDGGANGATANSSGIAWVNQSRIYLGDEEYVDIIHSQKIPLVAGKNVTFEVDQESDIVKVNATGGGDTSNLATVDKIGEIYTNDGNVQINVADESGISWTNTFGIYDDAGETIKYGALYQYLPIVAGNNIEFEVDEENQKVKINAIPAEDNVVGTWIFNYNLELTGGIDAYFNFTGYDADGVEREFNRLCINAIIADGVLQDYCVEYYDIDGDSFLVCDTMDAFWINDMSRTITIQQQPNDNDFITCVKKNATKKGAVSYVAKYVVSLSGGENVVGIINKLQEDYPDFKLGVWSIIEFTGATSGLYGLTIQHYGGNTYNIGGMDFATCYSMSNNVRDWSQVSVWGFAGHFQPPIPYCDDSYNGQVLKVVNGVPTWVNP